MKQVATIILLLSFTQVLATEQRSDCLIYNTDTIYIEDFPLEVILNTGISNDSECIVSDCWRGYVGYWRIENDSLFLIELRDCCDKSLISLNRIFDDDRIQDKRVFAYWYSSTINAEFGNYLGFSEEEWKSKYDQTIEVKIKDGVINNLTIKPTDYPAHTHASTL